MQQYRFLKDEHLHQLLKDGEWKNLTGTSSVVDVLYKPLAWWSSGKAVELLGWLHPEKHTEEEVKKALAEGYEKVKGLDLEGYRKLLDKAYRAHNDFKNKAAKKGTDLHAELECFVKAEMGIMEQRKFDEKIMPFIEWAKKNVKKFLWSEAHCYSESYWVGGISDAGCELKDGTLAVIDFKSSKSAYPTAFLQDAGYALQIEENGLFNADGTLHKKIDGTFGSLIVVPFGAEKVKPIEMRNVNDYKEGFKAAVQLYRLLGLSKS